MRALKCRNNIPWIADDTRDYVMNDRVRESTNKIIISLRFLDSKPILRGIQCVFMVENIFIILKKRPLDVTLLFFL